MVKGGYALFEFSELVMKTKPVPFSTKPESPIEGAPMVVRRKPFLRKILKVNKHDNSVIVNWKGRLLTLERGRYTFYPPT